MAESDRADVVIVDAEVWTGEPALPRAQALAAKDGVLLSVGSNAEAEQWAGELTDVRSLRGAFVCPGFIDAHTHVAEYAARLSWLRLEDCRSPEEVCSRVRERAQEGGWILGRGWDESQWPARRYLTREELDAAAGKNPALLVRVDGHMLVANSAALEAIQVPAGTPIVETDGNGRPTGVLKERAAAHALAQVKATTEQILQGLPEAIAQLHRLGITTVHDMVGSQGFHAWAQWAESYPVLRVSTNFYLTEMREQMAAGALTSGAGDEWLRLGAAKVFADGSLGSRTAALSRPYEDDRHERGMLLHSLSDLRALTREAHFGAFQLAVHAIGDRACYVIAEELGSLQAPDSRHRIEHFELPGEAALEIAKAQGLVVSMQPNFVGQWSQAGGLYEQRLGERYEGNNPFREILDHKIPLCFGSDGMPYGPLSGVHAAVNAPFAEQRLTVEEALRAYTSGGAYATSEEARKGTLVAGKFADFVVLDRDPRKEPDRIREVGVTATAVGGRFVHGARRAGSPRRR